MSEIVVVVCDRCGKEQANRVGQGKPAGCIRCGFEYGHYASVPPSGEAMPARAAQ